MSLFLHLSDPHFGTERPPVCEALIALAHRLAPDAVIISGDLTQRATRSQFAAAARFVQALPKVPMLVLPGNHDIPLAPWHRLFSPLGRFRHHFGCRPDPVLELDSAIILGVDTTRRWRQQYGVINRKQIERVAERLKTTPAQKWRIVVTHHPLLLTPGADWPDRPLLHAEALDRWFDSGADLFLNGHVHRPAVLPVASGSSGQHQAFVSQAGTACSLRQRGGQPNSVTVLHQDDTSPARIRSLEHWTWSDRSRSFERSGPTPLGHPFGRGRPRLHAVA
ncbi:metallophosphoesterase family protein [Uliginosibacterium paludis]|uniref:Metallophosphoesterase n=1 Tax=Uliginosibacterium paludis TaxID=1615952 RepID=A0ABV2CWW8_9RHOO